MDTSTQSIQVRGREPRRRFRTVEEKCGIVEETLQSGASVARVARAHGVNANLVFTWRRLYLRGQLDGGKHETPDLLAVRVVPGVQEAVRKGNGSAACGTIQIELPQGTVRIVGIADPASLETVLEYLRR
jgi:transposase